MKTTQEDKNRKEELKFKVGDRVRWISGDGTVKEVNEKHGSYLVKWDGGCEEWMGKELKAA
jgi:transcription antitermination factor NusG